LTGIIHFEAFLAAAVLLNLTPGNDTIFILTKSIGQGKKAGFISALGIATGLLVHTLLTAFGLSLVIAKSLLLFSIIKYAGAAYLVFLGFQMFVSNSRLFSGSIPVQHIVNYRKIYRDAIFTNVLNPKVALFFISFLPQFVDPSVNNYILPFLLLGSTFITTGTIWCLVLAGFAAAIFSKLKQNKNISSRINKICGLTLIGLGINVALMNQKR
jgi:threonine/homoserine/homoserine lactone efflux protein